MVKKPSLAVLRSFCDTLLYGLQSAFYCVRGMGNMLVFPFCCLSGGLSYVCLDRWRKDNQWFWLIVIDSIFMAIPWHLSARGHDVLAVCRRALALFCPF